MTQKNRQSRLDPDTQVMLREQLEHCRKAIETCFSLSPKDTYLDTVMDSFVVGTRLIKTSLMLTEALGGKGSDFTHRIVVEHVPSLPPPQTDPRPGGKIPKTIKSGSSGTEPQE